MAITAKKSQLGVEDMFFDSNGTGATAAVLCSDGVSTRTVQKINASHIPLPAEIRTSLDGAVNIATAIEYILQSSGATAAEASTTQKGVVELAEGDEVIAGTNPLLAITPTALISRTALSTRTGLVQLATLAETLAGADTAKAVTPATLKAAIDAIGTATVPDASATVKGIVELATTEEATTGTDTSRAVTPAGLAAAILASNPTVDNIIAQYGTVSGSGSKLAGSSGWTVSRNQEGTYQLNITVSGNYIVIVYPQVSAYESGNNSEAADSSWTTTSSSTGFFVNNALGNVCILDRSAGDKGDCMWSFIAIKVG